MADHDKSSSGAGVLPPIPARVMLAKQTLLRGAQEAPYRSLIGVVVDGKEPPKYSGPENACCRVRKQAGLTNRWRTSESLYSDLLGSRQALKAINLPFNNSLVKSLNRAYPSLNPVLNQCKDFTDISKYNWSVLKKVRSHKFVVEDEDLDFANDI